MEFHLHPRAVITIIAETQEDDLNFTYRHGPDGNLYHKPLKCDPNFYKLQSPSAMSIPFQFTFFFFKGWFAGCSFSEKRREIFVRREEMASLIVLLFYDSFMYF